MRNKGFFWFLTILMTVICVYQLSFTFVASGVEAKADKEATRLVAEFKKEAAANGNKGILPNSGAPIDFNDPESDEIAHADYVNMILTGKADKSVYPVLGSTFKEVKSRSLAFGLDLVGGMSITMEISIPGMVESYGRTRDIKFKRTFGAASEEYNRNGGDFLDILIRKNKKMNPGDKLVELFATHGISELSVNSSDAEVEKFFRDLQASAMDGVEEIMERRINQFGVAQPNIQKDEENNRIYIELPGVQDEKTVAARLGATANLEFYEVASFQEIGPMWAQAESMSLSAYDINADEDTEEEAEADSTGKDTILNLDDIELENIETGKARGLADLVEVTGGGFIVGYGKAEDKTKVRALLARHDIAELFPNITFMWSEETYDTGKKGEKKHALYACKAGDDGKARLTGKDIDYASDGFDGETGEITVNLSMTNEGAEKWAQLTGENVNEVVAITLDSVVYSAPVVEGAIVGGQTRISGSFTLEEARGLAGLLNAGALPAPCVIKEQSRVGPTIGAENSAAGLFSFGFALLLVFAYMIFYYGKAGIIADIALIANILFIFGSLASFGAVLTLSGIAGIVLTIGMAVDANVLIFERIREELAGGKDMKLAIDTGFQKALSSIIDANVTTMLTAIVLKAFGQGPIESFATTLIIGIFTSVFAALVITRLFMIWWMNRGSAINFDSKITRNAFKNLNFDFVGKRKMYYLISSILVVGSIAMIGIRGFKQSVEFTGGRTFGYKFEKSAGEHIDVLENKLKDALKDGNGKSASVELKTKQNSFFLEITTNYMLNNEGAETNEIVKSKISKVLTTQKNLVGDFKPVDSRSVSAQVSKELISSSMIAILLSLVIIFGYILMRFGRWQYSTGAILAMMHDVIIVLGIFAAFHGILPFSLDIDQAFVAAILTVIGYSINDTVIVFDRIRENLGLHKSSNEQEQINNSLNSTLSRTINTSMTTFIVLLIIFLFGGPAIKGFIFALMMGVLVGTYSSVCIATPILIDFTGMKKANRKKAVVETSEA